MGLHNESSFTIFLYKFGYYSAIEVPYNIKSWENKKSSF